MYEFLSNVFFNLALLILVTPLVLLAIHWRYVDVVLPIFFPPIAFILLASLIYAMLVSFRAIAIVEVSFIPSFSILWIALFLFAFIKIRKQRIDFKKWIVIHGEKHSNEADAKKAFDSYLYDEIKKARKKKESDANIRKQLKRRSRTEAEQSRLKRDWCIYVKKIKEKTNSLDI